MSAANINRTVISGNLTQDPELRHTGRGTPVCRLRVAVNSRRKDGQTGEWVDKPNYFNVVVWGKHGETCAQYLAKGRRVSVEGRLDWREWEADGNKREAVEIIADTVEFGPKPQQSGGGQGSSEKTAENTSQQEMGARSEAPAEPEAAAEAKEEDIPF